MIPRGKPFFGNAIQQTTTHFLVVHDTNRLGEWIAFKFCYAYPLTQKLMYGKKAQNKSA